MSIETEAPHQWAAEEVAYANEGQMSTDRDLEEQTIKRDTSEGGVTERAASWRCLDASSFTRFALREDRPRVFLFLFVCFMISSTIQNHV